jgi:hypothetical protein
VKAAQQWDGHYAPDVLHGSAHRRILREREVCSHLIDPAEIHLAKDHDVVEALAPD